MTGYSELAEQALNPFHGEALAHDEWADKYGIGIVLGFAIIYVFFLIGMNLAGQIPGQSFALKSASDIMQFAGEAVGGFFCLRIVLRLRRAYLLLRRELIEKQLGRQASNNLEEDRAETYAAQRGYLAWLCLTIAIGLYALGQAIWTSYDVRMNSADVPFPGLYDVGFVASYGFFLVGTLLLTRRGEAAVKRTYLLLDAMAIIGAALALSWFFLLHPAISMLPKQPGPGAAFLSIYFPTGDLFLVAVAAFVMFSPLSDREQQPVFLLLCSGLCFLALTDSLFSYANFASGFNTGTLQDVFWPASMQLIGLAAIAYPHSIARIQQRKAEATDTPAHLPIVSASNRSGQITALALTILPLILVLATCALLLLRIAPMGGMLSLQSNLAVLALFLILLARQALTLLENNRLFSQLQNDLTSSRDELRRKRREAEEANRRAQEKVELEEGLAALRSVYTRVVRGDFTARAPTITGPLQQIAVSLNMMLDQINANTQQRTHNKQLLQEFKAIQEAIEHSGQGLPPWSSSQPPAQCTPEFRTIFFDLYQLHAHQTSQRRHLESAQERVTRQVRQLRETLTNAKRPTFSTTPEQTKMLFERLLQETKALEQQQQVINQLLQNNSPIKH